MTLPIPGAEDIRQISMINCPKAAELVVKGQDIIEYLTILSS